MVIKMSAADRPGIYCEYMNETRKNIRYLENVSFYGRYCYTFFYPLMYSAQKEDQEISKTKM